MRIPYTQLLYLYFHFNIIIISVVLVFYFQYNLQEVTTVIVSPLNRCLTCVSSLSRQKKSWTEFQCCQSILLAPVGCIINYT